MFPKLEWQNTTTLGKFRQFLATVCLGAISYGASLGWTSPVLAQLENNNSTSSFTLTTTEGSWVGAMLAVGVLSAAIPSGYIADRFGIKKCVIALVAPILAFTMIVVFTRNFYALCIARFLSGTAAGGVSVIGPMYISEISDVSLRGTLGSFFEFLIYVGVLFVAVCGAYLDYITLTIILGVFTLVLGIIFLFLPESPTHLMKIRKIIETEKALKFYRGNKCDIAECLQEIQNSLDGRRQKKINIGKSLVSKPVMRGLIACVGITVFQQLSGVCAVIFYTVQIFQAAGTNLDEYTSSIILTSVQLLSAVVAVFIIEKAGRRFYLYLSTMGAGISLAFLGIYFHLKEFNVDFAWMNIIPITSLVVFAFAFAVGLGPVPWMINGELFSHEIKGVANGITISTNWISVFTITKTFPIMMTDFGAHYTFYLYSACMAACIVFIKFCIPETRGKSLEQIQMELNL